MSELSSLYGVRPTVIFTWENEFLKRSDELFSKHGPMSEIDFKKGCQEFYAKIGELEMQRE
ncbi:hypothetical protein [Petrimonas sp.]|uniref:hypothetical protein n=1 Tax=Petrimonas sp. TaxID=2023866 RepID=UPI002FC7DC9C